MTTWARAASIRAAGVADEPAVRRATALVTVVMCLLAVSEAAYGASNGLGEVPMVGALLVVPLLYVVPATRRCSPARAAAVPRRRGQHAAEPRALHVAAERRPGEALRPAPDETWVYLGHGNNTTLGAERPHLAEWRERGW